MIFDFRVIIFKLPSAMLEQVKSLIFDTSWYCRISENWHLKERTTSEMGHKQPQSEISETQKSSFKSDIEMVSTKETCQESWLAPLAFPLELASRSEQTLCAYRNVRNGASACSLAGPDVDPGEGTSGPARLPCLYV